MILPLEKQVASPQLARRLKQLGLPQSCVWSWVEDPGSGECALLRASSSYVAAFNQLAAPTAGELGAWLPPLSRSEKDANHDWICWCPLPYEVAEGLESHTEVDANEAEARARMLIYLIENSIVTVSGGH